VVGILKIKNLAKININVGISSIGERNEIARSTPSTFTCRIVRVVLTPATLEFNILISSVKLLAEVLDRFHILFTAHVNGELISSCSIRFYCHNINWVILKRLRLPDEECDDNLPVFPLVQRGCNQPN